MATEPWTDMKIDIVRFSRNRNLVPLDYQTQFLGSHVAWHMDGTHVVASAPTGEGLDARLRELGIPDDEVVCEHFSDADPQW